MTSRTYSEREPAALRRVARNEWGAPAHEGPAQYATGEWWPNELERLARDYERRVVDYRIAAAAMRREINKEGHQ